MSDTHVWKVLAEFFKAEFDNDATSISEWLAQRGDDADEFMAALDRAVAQLNKEE